MNWGAKIFLLRLRMVATSPLLWVLLLIAAIFSLLPIQEYKQNKQNLIPIAIINHDEGEYSAEFVGLIKALPNFTIDETDSLQAAQRKLSIGEYEAIVEITDNFSTQIAETEFDKVYNVYVSPSSSVAVFLIEVLAEKYIEIWGQELVLNDYRDLLSENNKPVTEQDIAALRADMLNVTAINTLMELNIHQQNSSIIQEEQRTPESALQKSALYFCAIVIIFIFLSSSWVIDLRVKGVALRLNSMGISTTTVMIASNLAMAFICEVFLLFTMIIGTIILQTSIALLLEITFASLLYFVASISLSILISSMLKESISLMLISPIIVLINSLFGGMLTAVPSLTTFWQKMLFLLPGRQLSEVFISGNILPLIMGVFLFSFLGGGTMYLINRQR